MSFISPDQVVSITVQSTEAPDANPTVHKVYAVTAAGTYTDITSATGLNASASLVDATSGAYRLTFIVPSNAAHGDRYIGWLKFLYSTEAEYIGGETDCVDLKPHGLTAGQEGQLDSLGSGTVVAINPVGEGGKVTLHSGYDYVTDTTPIDIPDSSPSSLPVAATPVTLIAETDDPLVDTSFELSGVVVLDGDNLVARIEGPKESLGDPGNWRYRIYHTPSGTLKELDVFGNLVIID